MSPTMITASMSNSTIYGSRKVVMDGLVFLVIVEIAELPFIKIKLPSTTDKTFKLHKITKK